MPNLQPDLAKILTITKEIGHNAAKLLRSYYQGTVDNNNLDNLQIQYQENEPVTLADIAVSEYIISQLQAAFGNKDFGYISEETYKQNPHKNPHEWVWIIDPLDGTRDFINKTGEYAIHIALVKGTSPVLAVVAIPEAEKLYFATKNGGTFVENKAGILPLKIKSQATLEDLTLVVSRSHRNAKLEYLLENLPCKKQLAIGSVGCKISAIIESLADVYISISGKSAPKDWDMAAPELIFTEAGGSFTYINGEYLRYNTGEINQWETIIASSYQDHHHLCQLARNILF
ncbi:3'(2'),5'-bisphosphate nucleotidase CysQ [Anabaena sp. FACHB-1237]|nr:3'(2'),5'-bisphosphate nucleotidase CysQ [Anabaena sp. FACHB-1237]